MTRTELALTVEPIAGSHIKDCFEQASRLARQLKLALVRFSHNGRSCTAYPSGEGTVYDESGQLIAEWTEGQGFRRRDIDQLFGRERERAERLIHALNP